jgi:hypothetical protein
MKAGERKTKAWIGGDMDWWGLCMQDRKQLDLGAAFGQRRATYFLPVLSLPGSSGQWRLHALLSI